MTAARKSILVVLIILLIDQTVKFLVKTHMTLYQQIPYLGHWAVLHFVENNGMAFGLSLPGNYGKIILSLFRILAVIAIGLYLRHLIRSHAHSGLIVALSMIFAGAMGNILDSAFYGMIFSESTPLQTATLFPHGGGYAPFLQGKVVDMFYFPLIRGSYPDWFRDGSSYIFFRPVFNIADASITLAVALILVNQKKYFGHLEEKTHEETGPASA